MDKIENLRNDINRIDNEIMKLLNERFNKSILVGQTKKISNITILDTKREDEILKKTLNYDHSLQIGKIYGLIMKESKLLQRK